MKILSNPQDEKIELFVFSSKKSREAIDGTFIISTDYQEMKKKNFWRIVTTAKAIEWRITKNPP